MVIESTLAIFIISIFFFFFYTQIKHCTRLKMKTFYSQMKMRIIKSLSKVSKRSAENDSIFIFQKTILNLKLKKLVSVKFCSAVIQATIIKKKKPKYYSFIFCTFLIHFRIVWNKL